MDPDWRCMNPIENGNIPASYVSLPEGNCIVNHQVFQQQMLWVDRRLVQAQRAVADIATFLKEKGINTCLGKKWGRHGENLWKWHHKAIKCGFLGEALEFQVEEMEIMTLLESGDVRVNSCHSFWKNLFPIITVQWKIGTRNERKRSYWRYTHFPLNDDYGRKGSDACRIKSPGLVSISNKLLVVLPRFFLKTSCRFTSIYCRSETVTDPVR